MNRNRFAIKQRDNKRLFYFTQCQEYIMEKSVTFDGEQSVIKFNLTGDLCLNLIFI